MKTLTLQMITPEGATYTSEPLSVTIDTADGQVTILAGHVPLIAPLVAGEVMVRLADDTQEHFAVHGGFVEVAEGSVVRILADGAARATELDEAALEEAIARAEELRAQEKDKYTEEYARISALIERDLTKLRVARRRKQ